MPQLEAPEKLAAKIHKTPGFTCTQQRRNGHGWWAVNTERKDGGQAASSTGIGLKFEDDRSFQNCLQRLRRIGWTYEVYRESKTAARDARVKAAKEADAAVAAALFAGTSFEDKPSAPTLPLIPAQRDGSHPDDYGVRAMRAADQVDIYGLDAFEQMTVKPVMIDRATAWEWMQRIPAYQRKRSPITERKYGRIMLRGEWAMIPHGILRDPDGMPLDGQTRLGAVLWATDPDNADGNLHLEVPFVVWENVPRAMFRYIDKQRRRSVANTLQGLGEKNPTQLGAVVRLLYLFDKVPQSDWHSTALSDDQIVGHLDANKDVRESMYWGKLRERGFNATSAITAHTILMRRYTDQTHQRYIDAWFDRLHHGYNLQAGDPSAALRDYLMTADKTEYNRMNVGARTAQFQLYLILKSWQNTLTHTEIKQLSPRKDFAVPRDLPDFPLMPSNARYLPMLPKQADAA
ncbi:hypothetical protein [Streptomyces sp. cg35]|uniref:hypothetical protein n=1 Tax=Streptomyces sp. cg35 TaxID=3421650 RepID=UPI003D173FB3